MTFGFALGVNNLFNVKAPGCISCDLNNFDPTCLRPARTLLLRPRQLQDVTKRAAIGPNGRVGQGHCSSPSLLSQFRATATR